MNIILSANTFFDSFIESMQNFSENITTDSLFTSSMFTVLLFLVVAAIFSRFAYEVRLLKGVNDLISFLLKNPYVNETNLVELNSKMKKVPRPLRVAWQEYMLNRDNLPGEYITSRNILERAEKNSGLLNIIRGLNGLATVLSIIVLILTFSNAYGSTGSVIDTLYKIVFAPLLIMAAISLATFVFRVQYSKVMTDLRINFNEFVRLINKASQTMPAYVDYEVLFTQKEIADGIPMLQEYLEKRAFEEQQLLERQKMDQEKYESFDFNELGIESAILLDRAMLESEKYFNAKRSLSELVAGKEQELYNFSKNFDEVTKDYERKAQAHKENMSQLNEQLNSVTIKIEADYIKKRYNEEQQKLQQLEKDYELALVRFQKQQAELEAEVAKINKEIGVRKTVLEESMKSEGKTYANKIYGLINKAIAAQNEPLLQKFEAEKAALKAEIDVLNQNVANREAELKVKIDQIDDMDRDLKLKLAQIEAIGNVKDYFSSKEFRERVQEGRKSKHDDPSLTSPIDDMKKKMDAMEQQLKLANEKQTQFANREAELVGKINEIEKSRQDVIKEYNHLKDAKTAASSANKITELNENISAENEKLAKNTSALNKVNEAINKLDGDKK